jgi:hypothetical protein
MKVRTIHERTARKLATGAYIVFMTCAVLIAAIICSGQAAAQPDPHIPWPPIWCPGNGPGISASGYGGYCEGVSYPDGSRWNIYRIGAWWQPMRCIIPDGSMSPPLAGPGGCGGVA